MQGYRLEGVARLVATRTHIGFVRPGGSARAGDLQSTSDAAADAGGEGTRAPNAGEAGQSSATKSERPVAWRSLTLSLSGLASRYTLCRLAIAPAPSRMQQRWLTEKPQTCVRRDRSHSGDWAGALDTIVLCFRVTMAALSEHVVLVC